MFKILGADGREYGPVAVDQIKKWIAEGRANRETMAQQTGEPGWKPLGQFAEFADVLGAAPPAAGGTPPPVTAAPGSPAAPGAGTQGGVDARARIQAQQMVTPPAIGLMVAAGLGIAGSLIGMLFTLAAWGATPELPHGFDPDAARIIQTIAYGSIGISLKVIGIAVGIFILFGAIRMQKMTGHGLAMTAAIIAMIPCLSPCCLLGVPFGIWALVVLSKPEVKSQFH